MATLQNQQQEIEKSVSFSVLKNFPLEWKYENKKLKKTTSYFYYLFSLCDDVGGDHSQHYVALVPNRRTPLDFIPLVGMAAEIEMRHRSRYTKWNHSNRNYSVDEGKEMRQQWQWQKMRVFFCSPLAACAEWNCNGFSRLFSPIQFSLFDIVGKSFPPLTLVHVLSVRQALVLHTWPPYIRSLQFTKLNA